MKEVRVPPRAAALSESMRDIGYSLETAVADIIDNSISAKASKVDMFIDVLDSGATLAIIDDGFGMNEKELIKAMRHGSQNPRIPRAENDLGRFGLGLKTATFSQCTKLTVISSKDGTKFGAVWDLNLISDRDDWILCLLNDNEIEALPYVDRLDSKGTLVLWENLDRLCEGDTKVINEKLVNEKIREVEKHLSLVFHRFLKGEIKGKKIELSLNYHALEPFDPFCISNKATQLMNQEVVRLHGDEVVIQPYILPYHSKLSQKEKDFYNNRSDFLNNQGVYIYRNGRLIAWGDWFRLVPKGERTKLARVSIDFSNSLDGYWTIDIKKSRAYPPHQVKEQIRKIIGRIVDNSTRVISGKGKKLYESVPKPLWLRTARQGAIKYSLDREHPVISAIKKDLEQNKVKKIEEVLSMIESSVPIETIYSDYAVSPQKFKKMNDLEVKEVLGRLEDVWTMLTHDQDISEKNFRETVTSVKPFCEYENVIEEFIREKFYA